MKLLGRSPAIVNIRQQIERQEQGDYVYMYPPRQAYRAMPQQEMAIHVAHSLSQTSQEPLNLYVHFPFCKQICRFCNLYAMPISEKTSYIEYINAIIREANQWIPLLRGRRISTVYLGGGTPSLIPADELDKLLTGLENVFDFDRGYVSEVV